MQRAHDLTLQAAALCVVLGLIGCGSASEPTAPASASERPAGSNPAQPSAIVARYDLQQIGDRQLPLTYSGGGASWQITGGHYFLAADNSYVFGYDINGATQAVPAGRYVLIDATTVRFYLAPGSYPQSQFYQERGGLFSTGRIQGDVMTVTYEDFVDFEIEKYILSGS